ncbi:hypothetical protein CBOM_03664 [Ceraceosorus bombacis]|uniref:Uncharacterized protein n=1 Tax=Ceraceosorus bombacis TaxID=401625 RepID=A0A0P1BI98_9BASI|nr:hypothetical protein CBOM_03664 [Ceraceosorus bombacis]
MLSVRRPVSGKVCGAPSSMVMSSRPLICVETFLQSWKIKARFVSEPSRSFHATPHSSYRLADGQRTRPGESYAPSERERRAPAMEDTSQDTAHSARTSTTELSSTDPLDVYLSLVERGLVRKDDEQIRVMVKVSAQIRTVRTLHES